MFVNSLIDTETKRWNESKLGEIFVQSDVQKILRNQPVMGQQDLFTWRFNKNGELTVKSAFWLASSLKALELIPEAFTEPSINVLKEKVWKVKTVPKIRVFLWKALSSALPTADLIRARGMKIDNRCQTCGSESESINHTLFECTFARLAWAESTIPSRNGGFDELSVFTNISFLLNLADNSRLMEDDKRSWPWILWNIWKRRNEMLFEGRCVTAVELVLKAGREADEWYTTQQTELEWREAENIVLPSSLRKWSPPEPDWTMCNVRMDFSKSSGCVGGAWVLRNSRGVVICHSRKAFSGIRSRDEAKMVVVLWAFESMRSQRQSNIIFAGEFGDLFGALQRPKAWPSFLFQISIMEKELEGITKWKVKVVTREANRGAFFIAQSVIKYGLVNSYVARGHPS